MSATTQPKLAKGHLVDCPRCEGACNDPSFPRQPCAECHGEGKVTDNRPGLSPSGNPIALERLIVSLWGAIAACEALLEDTPDDEDNTYHDDGLRYSAEGLLFNLKSSESFFDSEAKWFPALAIRRAGEWDEGSEMWAVLHYLGGNRTEAVVTAHRAMMERYERLDAAKDSAPILVEA